MSVSQSVPLFLNLCNGRNARNLCNGHNLCNGRQLVTRSPTRSVNLCNGCPLSTYVTASSSPHLMSSVPVCSTFVTDVNLCNGCSVNIWQRCTSDRVTKKGNSREVHRDHGALPIGLPKKATRAKCTVTTVHFRSGYQKRQLARSAP